jgi:hypothetical protein
VNESKISFAGNWKSAMGNGQWAMGNDNAKALSFLEPSNPEADPSKDVPNFRKIHVLQQLGNRDFSARTLLPILE